MRMGKSHLLLRWGEPDADDLERVAAKRWPDDGTELIFVTECMRWLGHQ